MIDIASLQKRYLGSRPPVLPVSSGWTRWCKMGISNALHRFQIKSVHELWMKIEEKTSIYIEIICQRSLCTRYRRSGPGRSGLRTCGYLRSSVGIELYEKGQSDNSVGIDLCSHIPRKAILDMIGAQFLTDD
jgi:hypothetical protein